MICIKVVLFFCVFLALSESVQPKKIVCYYGSWAAYRRSNGQVKVNNINPNLCSHIIYSFVGLNSDGTVKILDFSNDVTNGGFKQFINLKRSNPRVKLLIAMGGWNEGSEKYSEVMKSDWLRIKLVYSILRFTNEWGFDGFDLDWEYPAQRGGASQDRKSMILFLKELRERSMSGFLISAAVGAADYLIPASYDVPNMNKYLDFINLMTYDYNGSWNSYTGHNSPFSSVAHTVDNWIRNGASNEKLIIGIPVYGRTWTLSNPNSNAVNSYASGVGRAGKYTLEGGMMTYLEICESFYSPGWKKSYDGNEKVPYAFKNDQWLSYDDTNSVKIKAKMANDRNLGGVMIWSIDGDDVFGVCGERPFPILKALNSVIKI